MKIKTYLLPLSAVLLAAPLFGQAVLLQDDFSTVGVPDTNVWNVYRATTTVISPTKFIEVTDTNSAQYFGTAGNPYLRMNKEDASGGLWVTASNQFAGNTLLTVGFDFYMPSVTSWGAANTGADPRIRLGINDPVGSNANRVPHEIRFNQGGVGGISNVSDLFSQNTAHSILIVYNHSSATATYVGSSLTVPASSYDVWLDGARVIAGAGGNVGTLLAVDTPMTSVGLAGFNGEATEFFVDNFAVYSGAIPEPSTYALGAGLLALAGAFVWRRRKVRS